MILDTNAVSGILAGDAGLASILGSAKRHELPVIVVGEYRFGLIGLGRRRVRLQTLFDCLVSESALLDVDETTAHHYASIRHELKVGGHPIPENDIWIAALARQHELAVVSRDPHFDAVRGNRRYSW